jgi:co-chaperonin GroES (HSP10)
MIRPYGDRILIEKLDGHGKETVSAGGIHLPAVEWRQGKTKYIADTFRARVVDVGPLVAEVSAGDEVFVLTYGDKQTLTGEETPYGLIIGEDDVLGVIESKPSDVWRCTKVDQEARVVTYEKDGGWA